MPNGGSDCCMTCPFNGVNKGDHGYPAIRDASFHCEIRGCPIPNPAYTYCNNHPRRNPLDSRTPRGPVWSAVSVELDCKPLREGLALPAGLYPPQGDASFIRVPYFEGARPEEARGGTCSVCGEESQWSITLELSTGDVAAFCSASHYLEWWLGATGTKVLSGPGLLSLLEAAQRAVGEARTCLARGDPRTALDALGPVDGLLTESGAARIDVHVAGVFLSAPELRGDAPVEPMRVEVALSSTGRLLQRAEADPAEADASLAELQDALVAWRHSLA